VVVQTSLSLGRQPAIALSITLSLAFPQAFNFSYWLAGGNFLHSLYFTHTFASFFLHLLP